MPDLQALVQQYGGYSKIPQEALARKQAGEALTDIGRSYNVSHLIGNLLPKHNSVHW